MIYAETTKNYFLLRKIRKIIMLILLITSLCFLFVLSYYITYNCTTSECNPTELLEELTSSINTKNTKKIITLTDISESNNSNDCIRKITDAVSNSEFTEIQNSEKQIVVQSKDYIIYNTTFNIKDKSSGTYQKTIPIMYIKKNDKWFINSDSILSLYQK